MVAPTIAFFLTGGIAAWLHIKYGVPAWQAQVRLEQALKERGLRSFHWNFYLQLRMHRDPTLIFGPSDTDEIRNLKKEVVRQWEIGAQNNRRVVMVLLIGTAVTFIAAMVENFVFKPSK